jgi:hypothetical protein
MAKYYTLAIREEDGIWAEQFGDYDLDVVRDEQRDQDLPARLTAIIHSDDHQDKIQAAIAELNRDNKKPGPDWIREKFTNRELNKLIA